MFLTWDFSPFFQALEVNVVQLIQHCRRLIGGPNIEGRCVLRGATVAMGGSEGLSHALVKEVAQGAFHSLYHFLAT